MTVVPAVAGPVHAYRTVVYTWGEGVSWDAPIVARVGTVATARVCGCVRPPPTHTPRLVRKRLDEETWHDENALFADSVGLSRRLPRPSNMSFPVVLNLLRNALVAFESRVAAAAPLFAPAEISGRDGAVRFERGLCARF